jgi:DNA mismatch repair protein MutS2
MPFATGDEVFVASLQKNGRIVEAGASGRYRVAVGSLSTWCDESQLSRVGHARRKGSRQSTGAATGARGALSAAGDEIPREATDRERRRLQSIDLHGMTVDEALRAVEARLDEAIRAGLDRLEIVHGISGGRLRSAVRGYLTGIGSVRRFEPDARNAGVTWVYF